MKKTFIFACVAAMTLASCGNKAPNNDEANVENVEVVDPSAQAHAAIVALTERLNSADAYDVEDVLQKSQQYYEYLVDEHTAEEAAEYALAMKKFIEENNDAINKLDGDSTHISTLVSFFKSLPTNAETAANDAVEAAKSDANAAVENAKSAASAAVEEKVNEAKDAAQAVQDKVDEAKNKVDDAKSKADEKVNQAKAVGDAAKKLLQK